MAETGFVVEGLSELIRDLKALDSTLPRAVSAGLKKAMTTQLLPDARALAGAARVPAGGAMVSAFGQQKAAGLKLHYSRYPWAAGAEWGSKQYRQFRPWVGNQWSGAGQMPGYIVGAAFRANLTGLDKVIMDAVRDAVLAKRGLI